MIHAVRCPSCDNLSRVGADSVGQAVTCPHCGRPFDAAPDRDFAPPPRRQPVVARFAGPRAPVVARLAEDQHSDAGDLAHGPNPLLVAMTLLPLGIPLLWLVGPPLTGHQPVFSFAAPVALALGLGGLTLGIGFAHGWSPGTRLRAVMAVILVGYFAGGFLFFLKKEWAEAVRRHVGPEPSQWIEFAPPHDKTAYKVRMPGHPQLADGLLPGWDLKGYRYSADRKGRDAFAIVYEIAHGTPPAAVIAPKASDGDFFDKAKAAVCEGCKGEVVTEKEITQQTHPGREYVLTLPDGATNRIVRVYRVKDRAYYLAVEGAFIPNDAKYVERFFDTFYVTPK